MTLRLALDLPPDWHCLPTERAELARLLARARGAAESAPAATAAALLALLDQLRHHLRDERRARTLVALWTTTRHPPGDAASTLLAATCTLTTLTQTELATDLPLTVNTLLVACRPSGADTTDPQPTLIELPAGPAVRVVRRHPGQVAAIGEHYLVPFDDGRRAAALTLATPNVDHAEELSELFAAIAATLRIDGQR